jgi:CRP-like cAMP-binding protein
MDPKQETIRALLKTHILFGELSESDKNALERLFEVRDYQATEIIAHEDTPMDGMYIIHNGQVRLKQTLNGKRASIGELGKEASVGEIALLQKAQWPYQIVASGRVTALYLPGDKIRVLLNTHPGMLDTFKKHIGRVELSHRLRGLLGTTEYASEDLSAILDHIGVKNIKKGQAVFQQGQNDPRLYCVEKGAIDLVRQPLRGESVVLDRLYRGDLLGEGGALLGDDRDGAQPHSAVAATG